LAVDSKREGAFRLVERERRDVRSEKF